MMNSIKITGTSETTAFGASTASPTATPPRHNAPVAHVDAHWQRWAKRLLKLERANDRATALNMRESQERDRVRAAAKKAKQAAALDKAAAEEAAAVAAIAKLQIAKRVVWAEEAPGKSVRSKQQAKKAIVREKITKHQQDLIDKETMRVTQLEKNVETLRMAREIGGAY